LDGRKLLVRIGLGIAVLAVICVVGLWAVLRFVVQAYYIPSAAMTPTLRPHDVILVNKLAYSGESPKRGDIVVFPPPIPTADDFIKRVVGLPGERFRITKGIVYINDVQLAEPYVAEKSDYDLKVENYTIEVNDGYGWRALDPNSANIPPKSAWTSPDTIPPNCYIMLGDNRNDSEDSHIWGFAQNSGSFQTGPSAGTAARFHGEAFRIISPKDRVRDLKPS
jgi:signal peptidase I